MNEETRLHKAPPQPPEGTAAPVPRAGESRAGCHDAATSGDEQIGDIPDLARTQRDGMAATRPEILPPGPALDSTFDDGRVAPVGPEEDRAGATINHAPVCDATFPDAGWASDSRARSEDDVVIAGRYALRKKIGEGGMGEVWVARQSEPVKRDVAVKLIKSGMDSRGVLARFEQERQALAMMDHPNIARVYDGGLTPGGQPFFVMELVDGLSLTEFCDKHTMSARQRLDLFVPICRAVQHAHQKGIVHRDLKPANILVALVDGEPVPKVIDFGVAKATAGDVSDESMSTQQGAIVGTLEYMSPEQAEFSGEDIDTRADIYSLGVLLYELLTGLRPIAAKRLKAAALTEVIRIIREEEPSKPSTRLATDESLPAMAAKRRAEPRKLIVLLKGELDWVVMKCLEKRRDRRYESASGLAQDIERFLADEPVEARPPSAGYRLAKFLRRNKGAGDRGRPRRPGVAGRDRRDHVRHVPRGALAGARRWKPASVPNFRAWRPSPPGRRRRKRRDRPPGRERLSRPDHLEPSASATRAERFATRPPDPGPHLL